MKFLKELKEESHSVSLQNDWPEFMKELSYEDFGTRRFLPIEISETLWLSVQAGASLYSVPRKTLVDLKEYSHMEFAVIKNNNLVNVSEVIEDIGLIDKLEVYYDGAVYAFVPVELIEKLYLLLSQKERNDV